jgi:hypothetical protein
MAFIDNDDLIEYSWDEEDSDDNKLIIVYVADLI